MPSPALARKLRCADDEKDKKQEDRKNDDEEEESPTSSSGELDMEALRSLTRFVQMGGGQITRISSRSSTNSLEGSAGQTKPSSFALPTLLQQAPKTPPAGLLSLKHAPANASMQERGLPLQHSHFLPFKLVPELSNARVPNKVARFVSEDTHPEDDESTTSRFSTLSTAATDPYANALVLHREQLESARIDLEAEHVDSLAARLSTQRQDALAELKASWEAVPILHEDPDEIRVIWGGSSFVTDESGSSAPCNPLAAVQTARTCLMNRTGEL
eukprot:TRINITY_DN59444_c0_g1_i1.p1 TRINITY_DN59444_c0_g1~~TRINITY_DN59444_c0_g1_i1.p1  ORF type:complete len:273 (+),score=48.02 TRINITY_DN59444_c0_g1_i1:77-895(+)